MTNEYFQQMKVSFLEAHSPYICEESREQIEKAQTLEQFIGILHRYVHFKFFDQVPSLEWAQEWFGNYLPEANACGVYLNQIATVDNPKRDSFILLGKCHLNAILVRSQLFFFTLRDESELSLITYGSANATIRLKGDKAGCRTIHKSLYSRIKLHKI